MGLSKLDGLPRLLYFICSLAPPSSTPVLKVFEGKKKKEEEKEEEGEIYEEGVAVRGWVSMKIYVLKNSCKTFNVSMNVLCLQ